ncbi:MAG: hypothetical protein C5B53_11365 [Candidatus Melainabacteria bacterium]|nr:MAG: hypothetical protein C5B53_11365 [Candidatus Melainabacteria bacterium]
MEASMPLDQVRVTSKFGLRTHPVLKRKSFHAGIDLAAKLNENVKAISEGVVTDAGRESDLGNAVFISHPKLNVTSIYGHLNKIAVSKGDQVTAGQVIGYAGSTGLSTGVHLHLALKDQRTGRNIEPQHFLAQLATRTNFGSTDVQYIAQQNIVRTRSTAADTPLEKHHDVTTVVTSDRIAELQEAIKKAQQYEQLYREGCVSRNDMERAQAALDKLLSEISSRT